MGKDSPNEAQADEYSVKGRKRRVKKTSDSESHKERRERVEGGWGG